MKKQIYIIIFFLLTLNCYSQDKELKVNHIYFVIDSTSFEKIKYDEEFNSLANIDKGIPNFNKIDSTSTTLYLRGKSTYVEIMGPDNRFNEKLGSIGIGFSWDTSDSINNNFSKKLINESNLKFHSSNVKWMFENNEVLWYTAFYTEIKGFISTWYAYYNPKFLSNLYHQNYSTFTREQFLEKAYNKEKPITDLSEITLNCSADDFKKITAELNSFSLKDKKIKSNSATFYLGNIKLKLMRSKENKSSLKNIIFTAKTKLIKKSKDFGNLNLTNTKNKIIFNFK